MGTLLCQVFCISGNLAGEICLAGFFFPVLLTFFFYAFFVGCLSGQLRLKTRNKKIRNSDLESETLLEAVGESWGIQTKWFEQVFWDSQ